jgi:hypothetical protein
MLNSINITHIWVFDQNEALEFYVGKLGLEVSGDMDLGEMRWLTVRVPGQQGRDILLEKIGPPSVDPDAAQRLRELISKGASGFTAGFTTTNCKAVYETSGRRASRSRRSRSRTSTGPTSASAIPLATTSASCSWPSRRRRSK